MKKYILLMLALLPGATHADRLGSLNSNSNVLLTTQAVAGTVSTSTPVNYLPAGVMISSVTSGSGYMTTYGNLPSGYLSQQNSVQEQNVSYSAQIHLGVVAASTTPWQLIGTNGGTNGWNALPNMSSIREYHSVTVLQDGITLIACGGGDGAGSYSNTCDVIKNGVVTAGPNMNFAKDTFVLATLPNNNVVEAYGGGTDSGWDSGSQILVTTGPIASWSWYSIGNVNTKREQGTYSVLSTGYPFETGGQDTSANYLNSTEVLTSSGVWIPGPTMTTKRINHMQVTLNDGRVLICGGHTDTLTATNACEVCDMFYNQCYAAPSMIAAREYMGWAKLKNGNIYVAGGYNNNPTVVATAEVFLVDQWRWVSAPSMNQARQSGANFCDLDTNGNVVCVGGKNDAGTCLSNSDIFNPYTWTDATGPAYPFILSNHHITALQNGTLVVTGGQNAGVANSSATYYSTNSLENKTLVAGAGMTITNAAGSVTFSASGSAISTNTQTTGLGNGVVISTNGYPSTVGPAPYAYMDNESAVQNSDISNAGQVSTYKLATGSPNQLLGTSAGVNTWAAEGNMASVRYAHGQVSLANGNALLCGGFNGSSFLSSCDIYSAGSTSATGAMGAIKYNFILQLLRDGTVLQAAGGHSGASLSDAQTYNVATGVWTSVGSLNAARQQMGWSVLPNGNVLTTGGTDSGGSAIGTAEAYGLLSTAWTYTSGGMQTARYNHGQVTLQNGKVLIFGGHTASLTATATCEIYDPAADQFNFTGSMNVARELMGYSILPNGNVLVVGGYNNSPTVVATAEIYNWQTGVWASTGSMANARQSQINFAQLLPSGNVLVVGGQNNSGTDLSSSEIYISTGGNFILAGSLPSTSQQGAISLLANGTVLQTGGQSTGSIVISSTSIFSPLTVENKSILGTANQITVTHTQGTVTLSLPSTITNISTTTYNANSFSTLGSGSTNGTLLYCSDCTVTTPATCVGVISAACVCAGSGNGAFAKRLNGSWYCN